MDEVEFLALAGQRLAEIQALAQHGRVTPSDHLHWPGWLRVSHPAIM